MVHESVTPIKQLHDPTSRSVRSPEPVAGRSSSKGSASRKFDYNLKSFKASTHFHGISFSRNQRKRNVWRISLLHNNHPTNKIKSCTNHLPLVKNM